MEIGEILKAKGFQKSKPQSKKPRAGKCACGKKIEPIVVHVSLSKTDWFVSKHCQVCKNKMIEEQEAQDLRERKEKMVKAIIPPRFLRARLADLPDKKLIGKIQKILDDETMHGKGLFIHGKVGVGKTHLMVGMAKYLIDTKLVSGQFENLPNLLREIRESYNEHNESGFSTLDKYINTPVLYLDDIGVEKPTSWVLETLYTIINERYEIMRPIVFTSNLDLEELSNRLGDRIVSRIVEMCEILELKGKDRRI